MLGTQLFYVENLVEFYVVTLNKFSNRNKDKYNHRSEILINQTWSTLTAQFFRS